MSVIIFFVFIVHDCYHILRFHLNWSLELVHWQLYNLNQNRHLLNFTLASLLKSVMSLPHTKRIGNITYKRVKERKILVLVIGNTK